jgi:ATP-dependent DNA ligase
MADVGWFSRNGNEFKSFPALNIALALECRVKRAVMDGEIVCLDDTGNSQFTNLLFRRDEPRFYAFDLLSYNGEDLRYLPLEDRNQLSGIVPRIGERLLEGIVAKRKFDPYLPQSATWLKMRNPKYFQWIVRKELLE